MLFPKAVLASKGRSIAAGIYWRVHSGSRCMRKAAFCIRFPSRWQFPPWRCLRLLILQVAAREGIWRRWLTPSSFFFFQVALFAVKWGGMMTDGGERIIKAHTMQFGPNTARNNTSRLTLLSPWSHISEFLKKGWQQVHHIKPWLGRRQHYKSYFFW